MRSYSKVIPMLERMAEWGTAPDEGCLLFSVGYESGFKALRTRFIQERFNQELSSQKFIVGPFGSGKTHFIRRVAEMARAENCITMEVALTKEIDPERALVVYRECLREIRLPNGSRASIEGLLLDAMERIGAGQPDNHLLEAWVGGLRAANFRWASWGQVLTQTLFAHLEQKEDLWNAGCRWLAGAMEEKELCRTLGVSPVERSEANRYGTLALHSFFQFVRRATYQGTILAYDEAEQGLALPKARLGRVLSLLQSSINSLADLADGAALILWAITPDLLAAMAEFPALQQRVALPQGVRTFEQGNAMAPVIHLTSGRDPEADLRAIGGSLLALLYDAEGDMLSLTRDEALAQVDRLAVVIAASDPSSSNRRTMVKSTCSLLIQLYDEGHPVRRPTGPAADYADEV